MGGRTQGLILADSWPTPGQDAHSASDEMFVIYEKIYEKGENRERERERDRGRERERKRERSVSVGFLFISKEEEEKRVCYKKKVKSQNSLEERRDILVFVLE